MKGSNLFEKFKIFTEQYLKILDTDLKGLNLTAIKSFDDFLWKQVLDSIVPACEILYFKQSIEDSSVVVDLGTGGGIPLLPLAVLFPKKKFIGIDARNKKIEAISLIAKKLNIENVTVSHGRFEDFLFDQDKTVFVCKAVGKIDEIISTLKIIANDQKIFFYKGQNFDHLEVALCEKISNNCREVLDQKYQLESVNERRLVGYELSKNVPRGTFLHVNKKSLSKLIYN